MEVQYFYCKFQAIYEGASQSKYIRIFEYGAHLWSFTPPGGAMRMMTVINNDGHCMTRVQTQTSVTSALSL